MLEFYWAYADVNQMMDFCEQMLSATVFTVLGHTHVKFGEHEMDFGQPFQRMTMRESVTRFAPNEEITEKNLLELFEEHVEHNLVQPTLIYDFPKVVSPLSKASPANPSIAERFELFIAGMECANGFSELNDPSEQYQRFMDQVSRRERGDEEAMVMDEDYIRALSYGMPPAAGIGIGIDRFVMLLTNQQSIRDVILFPHMRPERLHQFSWMRWIYEELAARPNWSELTERQQAGLLIEKFRKWASQPDSPPHRRQLMGESEDDMIRTAQRALSIFREP